MRSGDDGRDAGAGDWRAIALLLVVCLLTFTYGLGRSAIQDSDEAYYAEAGREMVTSGDWITPHYNFEVRLQKPILYYWMVAESYRALGTGEMAARLPAALSGVGLALLASVVARRWIGPGVDLIAGLTVATSFGLVPFARQSLPDVPLAFFVSVACWAGIEAFSTTPLGAEAVADRRRGLWFIAAAAFAALGMLTKGPIAVAVPVAVIVPLIALVARRSRRFRVSVPIRALVAGTMVFVLIAGPWYLAETHAQGLAYLRQFFVGENLDRFATSEFNPHWRGYEYIGVIVFGLLPWSVFGVFWLRPLSAVLRRQRRLTALEMRLACWALGPFLLFFVSIGSQPRYILPCLVPIALLLAKTVHDRTFGDAAARIGGRIFTIVSAAAGLSLVAVGGLFLHAAPLLAAADPRWAGRAPMVMIGGGVLVLIAACSGLRRLVPGAMAVAGGAAMLAFELVVLTPGRPEPVEVVAAAARDAGPAALVCACGAFARSMNFYTDMPTAIVDTGVSDDEALRVLDRPDRVLAAIDAAVLARVEMARRVRYPRFADVRYLDTAVWLRPGTLLDPDPRYVQRVILISNR